jgi:hypothetical protein
VGLTILVLLMTSVIERWTLRKRSLLLLNCQHFKTLFWGYGAKPYKYIIMINNYSSHGQMVKKIRLSEFVIIFSLKFVDMSKILIYWFWDVFHFLSSVIFLPSKFELCKKNPAFIDYFTKVQFGPRLKLDSVTRI